MTVPPSLGPGRGQGPHGGGLPGAGGRDRQLQPGPGGGHLADQRGLPGVEGDPVGGLLEQGQRRRRPRWRRCPSATPGGVDEALLRRRGSRCEVYRAEPATSYTLDPSLRRSSAGSATPSRARVSRTERGGEGLVDDQVHDRVSTCSAGRFGGADLALRLGAHVPDLPGRPARPAPSSRTRCGGVPDPRRVHRAEAVLRGRRTGRRPPSPDTLRGRRGPPRPRVAPGGALLGQGARFVLGVAGLQGGLLGQLDRLDHGRWAAVVGLERGRELAAAGLDAARAGWTSARSGPGSTPTTSRTGRLPRSVPGRSAKVSPSRVAQVLLEGGVVGLRGGDVGLEQDPPVDGQPLPGQGLHLVRDRDVGVQVGVPGAGVAVGERGRDQPGDVDLADPVGALAGVQGVRLDERQRVGDGVVVGRARSAPRPPAGRPPTGC